jgi:acetolactate synthase-1/3 small subunit
MENQPGALSRVVGLFSQRGYNIDSLSVAPTQEPTLSRLTMTTSEEPEVINQILRQLFKLIDVVMVQNLTSVKSFSIELAIIKLALNTEEVKKNYRWRK